MVKLFEIKTAFLERGSEKREMMHLTVSKSNSIVSKTQQRKGPRQTNRLMDQTLAKKKGTVL